MYFLIFCERSFNVSTASSEEQGTIFTGQYMILPVNKPNTDMYIYVKFYLLPSDETAFELLIGMNDMKHLGYKLVLQFDENTIIHSNEPQMIDKQNYNLIEGYKDLCDRLEETTPNIKELHKYDTSNYNNESYNTDIVSDYNYVQESSDDEDEISDDDDDDGRLSTSSH